MTLWHGTLANHAQDIERNGIDLSKSRHNLDFGRGFYTTTSLNQATEFASDKYVRQHIRSQRTNRPALLKFRVPLESIATLSSLVFVRSGSDHAQYWAFVSHCRSSTKEKVATHLKPGKPRADAWYDVVYGPVAAKWPPTGRVAYKHFDQVSFHTQTGIAILEEARREGFPDFEIRLLKEIT